MTEHVHNPERRAISLNGGAMSCLFWDQAGPDAPFLHFAHANGFNAQTYTRILGPLADQMRIVASDLRGHGMSTLAADPETHESWYLYRDDLIALLETLDTGPVVLAGHSMGATSSLLVAIARPDLVRALVLFEPVILPRMYFWQVEIWRMLGIKEPLTPFAKGALNRRAQWPDRETVVRGYTGRGAFKTWPVDILADYVDGGTRVCADGTVELACAPAWEAANFSSHNHNFWPRLVKVTCPVTILRGAIGSTCPEPRARALTARLSHVSDRAVDGATHFLPMERPDLVVETLRSVVL